MAENITYIFKNSVPVPNLIRMERDKVIKNILNTLDAADIDLNYARFIRQVVLDQVNGYCRFVLALTEQDEI